MKLPVFIYLILFGTLCFAKNSDSGAVKSPPELDNHDLPSVLLINTYSSEIEWGRGVYAGFLEAFPETKYPISNYEIGVLGNPDLSAQQPDVDAILRKVCDKKIKVLVAVDQTAIDLVMANYGRFPESLTIILGGNVDPACSGSLPANVVCIPKGIEIDKNIELGGTLFPDARKIVVLTGGAEEGRAVHKLIQAKASGHRRHSFEFFNGREHSSKDVLKRLSEIDEPYFMLLYSWASPLDKDRIPKNVQGIIMADAAGGMVINMRDENMQACVGGYVSESYKMGGFLGFVASEVTEGRFTPEDLEKAPMPKLRVNMRKLIEMDISPRILPREAVFYSRPDSLLDNIGWGHIAIALTVFSVLVLSLCLLLLRSFIMLRRRGARVVAAHKFLRTMIDAIPFYIVIKDYSGGNVFTLSNKYANEHFAPEGETSIQGKKNEEVFPPEMARMISEREKEIVRSGKIYDEVEKVRVKGRDVKCRAIKVAEKIDGKTYIFGAIQDITDRVAIQEQQAETIRQQQAMKKCLEQLLLMETPVEMVEYTLKFLGESVKADRCWVVRYDSASERMLRSYEWVRGGVKIVCKEIDGTEPPAGVRRGIEIFKRGGFVECSDLSKCDLPEFEGAEGVVLSEGARSVLGCGVMKDGALFGFVVVEFINSVHEFTEPDRFFLRSAAQILELSVSRFYGFEEMRESEYRRRVILDSVDTPVLLFDAAGGLVSANCAAQGLACLPARDLMNLPKGELCRILHEGSACPVEKCIAEKKIVFDTVSIGERKFATTVKPVAGRDGLVKYIVQTFADVTEINDGNRLLNEALESAQEADRTRARFMATVTHELRTPLNAVIGYTELMQDGSSSEEECRQYVGHIDVAAKTLLSLVNDILDISKLGEGRMKMEKTAVDFHVVASEIRSMFTFACSKKGIYVRVNVADNMPVVSIDPLRFKQILINIISNSVKFTEDGGVSVSISYTEKTRESGTLAVVITDTGIGMSPEFVKKIFLPFEQESADENRRRGNSHFGGTGLGMAIVKNLIDEMGGEISVESVLDVGSKFSVVLPDIAVAHADEIKTHAAEAAVCEVPFTVLIVDDVEMNLKLLGKMLENLGVDSIPAKSAADAFEILKTRQPDLIMTDHWMPVVNGGRFAQMLKEDPKTSEIPVILVTADAMHSGSSGVFSSVLHKPFSKKSISDALKSVFPDKF